MEEMLIVMRTLLQTLADLSGHDVLIHEVWADSHTSACVVFEREGEDLGPIGYRVSYPPHAVGNDPTSTGESWALGLFEPLGASAHHRNPARCSWNWLGGWHRS
jgi:hypothetical protein